MLLFVGLGVGVLASLVAVVPTMRAPASDLSLRPLLLLSSAVGLAGCVWIALAASIAVRRATARALNEE